MHVQLYQKMKAGQTLSLVFCITVYSQVCELTGELYSVQEERDYLVSAQTASNEDNERVKGEAVKAQEELEKMQKKLADAELKEIQLSQHHTETSAQLAKVQTDLQHLLEENRSLLSALEETKHKVAMPFLFFFFLLQSSSFQFSVCCS